MEKELRIGNLVYYYGKVSTVGTLMKGGQIGTNNGHDMSSEFKPILLTEEWLVKFGFEKYKDSDRYYKGDFYFQNITLYRDRDFIANLEYVHKLQNLIFALTGKELTTL